MANEDPSGIPEQIRQTRPFMIALAIAFVVGIGTFLWILSQDVNENDLERTDPPPRWSRRPPPRPMQRPRPQRRQHPRRPLRRQAINPAPAYAARFWSAWRKRARGTEVVPEVIGAAFCRLWPSSSQKPQTTRRHD
ncbi:hypothetical protein QWZ10_10240 [Paracoccus cavernae]|uniref:Uncharacterized protein n=1 Tax=Paracoccus cavernae TaxID=1571207 RepID=A0ABT8D6D4_9RHOB|nr:hypothetical protein [Paracoccus cavernae]